MQLIYRGVTYSYNPPEVETNGNAQVLDTVPAPITKSRRNRLVARWLTDENTKLYCQWFIKD
jgi:hypothetical protein